MPKREEHPLEWKLFGWESWDTIEEGVYDFSGITLKVGIGPSFIPARRKIIYDHGAGKTFSHAVMNYQTSTVTFYDTIDDEVGYKYALTLAVGEKL